MRAEERDDTVFHPLADALEFRANKADPGALQATFELGSFVVRIDVRADRDQLRPKASTDCAVVVLVCVTEATSDGELKGTACAWTTLLGATAGQPAPTVASQIELLLVDEQLIDRAALRRSPVPSTARLSA